MRYRVKDYEIYFPAGDVQLIIFEPKDLTIEDIRLIVNETKNTVICSSMQKSNVIVAATQDHKTTVTVPKSVCVLDTTDQLTIEIDNGETLAIPTDYAKEETLNTVGKEVHEIAVGTDFTFVKSAIVSDSGTKYTYDGFFSYSPTRGRTVRFNRWSFDAGAGVLVRVCTMPDDTKVGGVIYGWTDELIPPEGGQNGKPTDPTGDTIASFEYDNLETEKMASANKQDILDAINNIPTPVIPNDYAKEDNATNNKLELLNKLNMLINMIGPGDSFANFVAAPNLIYLGTASYDEETNTIYIGEDGYYDENEQTIFING